MNPKQILPVIASVAPPLLSGVVIYYGLIWLFSADEEEKKQKNISRHISANAVNAPVTPAIPKTSASVPIPTVQVSKDLPQSPSALKRRIVLRGDLAKMFQHGAHSLYRIDAVKKLQKLGFCKTAAYEALSPDGRFAPWLQIASDGIISWQS